jgi:hypothetical protein
MVIPTSSPLKKKWKSVRTFFDPLTIITLVLPRLTVIYPRSQKLDRRARVPLFMMIRGSLFLGLQFLKCYTSMGSCSDGEENLEISSNFKKVQNKGMMFKNSSMLNELYMAQWVMFTCECRLP